MLTGMPRADGFNPLISVPDLTVTTTVPLAVGGDIANIKPNITDVSARLTHNTTNNLGFKVIMDEARTSILVSGRDGFIYLVDTESGYDVSSPWGSVNLTSGTVNLDVFGRVIAFTPDRHTYLVAQLKVYEPDKVASNSYAAHVLPISSQSPHIC